jgi:hypothetical protein
LGLAGRAWARPSRAEAAGEGKSGPRALGCEEKQAQNPKETVFSFLYLFLIFQSQFSKDFQIKFEFDLNHTIQNFKCSSMNAQSCFFPYI